MPVITFDGLKIYERYGGLDDSFARRDSPKEQSLINNTMWGEIDSAKQDLLLISRKLASKDFTINTLTDLKEKCDDRAFAALATEIPFFQDFQKVAAILSAIKHKLDMNTDIVWTHYNSTGEAINDIGLHIEYLKLCDFDHLNEVRLNFLPTGTYQELATTNDWGDEYLKLAEEFDAHYEMINAKIINGDDAIAGHKGKDGGFLNRLWSKIFARRS